MTSSDAGRTQSVVGTARVKPEQSVHVGSQGMGQVTGCERIPKDPFIFPRYFLRPVV